VVGMIVGNHQVVDLLHTRRFGRGDDAPGIAAVEPAIPYHQHGFAGGRNKQRGLSAFDVDEVDLEFPAAGKATAQASNRMPGNSFRMAKC